MSTGRLLLVAADCSSSGGQWKAAPLSGYMDSYSCFLFFFYLSREEVIKICLPNLG